METESIAEIGEDQAWSRSNNYPHHCAEEQADPRRPRACRRAVLWVFTVAQRMEMRSITGLKECDLAMPRRGSGDFEIPETTALVLEKRRSRKTGEWEGELERAGGEQSR